MALNGRSAFLAYNAAVAVAGAAAMFLLVRAMVLDSEPDGREGSQTAAVEEEVPLGRLTFLSSPPESEGSRESPRLRPGILSDAEQEAEATEAWSTETAPERTAPQPKRFALLPSMRFPWQSAKPEPPKRNYTLKARLAELSPAAGPRVQARFDAAKAPWPPDEIALIAIKAEKALELHARQKGGAWTLIHRYRVLAASGGPGPKLRQGDRQVPEGVYSIALLNPNSAYHVSLRVNYPNAFDRQMAAKEGRTELGGDIMIHGKNLSAGCLAMGDEAVEELFLLAARTGLRNVKVIIAPSDFREHGIPAVEPGRPDWLPKLYTEVATAMADFRQAPKPSSGGLLSFFMK
ncbi:MAG: hypothetical protein SFW09_01345 [Hyphomicrobiaceae bacterium]|nr:hypothetical protein [Hyphomicrobiaceae bacterium]